jgi:hypothetical protein
MDFSKMIATDGISDEQKASVEFQSAYADMVRTLNTPGFVDALCAHEAAHLVYYEMMGPIQYKLLPPRLEYDPGRGCFIGHFAAVQLSEEPACEPQRWREYVTMLSRAQVAGGVVGRKLFPSSSGGDEGDKEKFRRICTELVRHFGGIKIEFELVWKLAQDAVQRQLEHDPQILKMIQQRAVELRSAFRF